MKRRGRYQEDLDGEMLAVVAVIVVIVAVALAFVTFLALASDNSTRNAHITYNEAAEAINAHTLEERQMIAEFTTAYDFDEETYLVELKKVGNTWQENLQAVWPYVVVFWLIVSSVVTFGCYCRSRDHNYFLADLPMTLRGYVLFVAMFVMWPVLAISWIRMRSYFSADRVAERQEVERLAKARLEEERKAQESKTSEQMVAESKAAYLQCRTKMCKNMEREQKKHAQDWLKKTTEQLEALGQKIRNAQEDWGRARAEMRRVETTDYSTEATQQRIEQEWEAIWQMRGVSEVDVSDDRVGVLIKVEVPYKGAVYDFGDYRIVFEGFEWCCYHVRSGMRRDAQSTSPDYSTSRGFCFGNREDLITSYVRGGRYLEALTLIVDSLHSVNDEETARDIPLCFRQIRTIQTVQQKLARSGRR